MKTGQCKFGTTCKFHHPEFGGVPMNPGIYPPLQSPSIASPHPYASLANWQMGRPPVVPGSYIPGSYTPMMLSSGMIPLQGWSPYPVIDLNYMFYCGKINSIPINAKLINKLDMTANLYYEMQSESTNEARQHTCVMICEAGSL